jgi:uncharacterized protein (TIGR02466 family)
MKKIPAFTIPFYEFTANEQLTTKTLELAQRQQYTANLTNKSNVQELIKSKELITWFNSCLEEVKNDLYDKPVFDIKVTDAWFNKSSYTEKHHIHAHPNSVLSGVFYLTTHEKKAKTKFYLPNPFHHIDFSKVMYSGESFITSEKFIVNEIQPVAGKLIIFPSDMQHNVETNITRNDRYSIAFNSFFSGIIGKKDSSTMLHITVQYPDLE